MKLLRLLSFVILHTALLTRLPAYQQDCANTGENDPNCGPCEDSTSCPETSGSNPVSMAKASLLRHVTDLEIEGNASFVFKRIYNSRTRTYTNRSWELGGNNTWQHNWQFEMRESSLSSNGHTNLIVRYPAGREKYFFATDATGSIRTTDANFGDKLYSTSTAGQFILRTPTGKEYVFQKVGSGSSYQYLLQEVREGQGFKQTLTYLTQSDGLRRLHRITNNYGRFIQLNRTQVPGTSFWRITSIQSDDGRTVSYTYGTWAATTEQVLTSVTYPDATASTYTWCGSLSATTGPPLLASAEDPTYPGSGARCKYIYNYSATYGGSSIVKGTIFEERNLDNNQVTVRLTNGGGTFPEVLEGGVNPVTRKFSANNLIEHSDAEGRTTLNAFQSINGILNAGILISTKNSANATTTYTRDAAGRILTETNPLGGVKTFTYNNAGFTLTSQDELGRVTTHTRDTANRITRTDHPDTTFETFTYDSNGLKLTHRLRNGSTQSWAYTQSGDLATATNALGQATTHTYDAAGRRLTTTTPLGLTTSFLYDWRSRPTRITHPDATFRTITYDFHGNVSMEADELLNITLHEFDSFNRRTKTTDPLGRITTFSYASFTGGSCTSCSSSGAASGISSITHPDGTITSFTYDKSSKKLTETRCATTPYAATTTFTYNIVGDLATTTDALGKVTTTTYDPLRRPITTRDPLNRTTTTTYDAVGNTLTLTLPDGSVYSNTHDVMDRLLTSQDPLSHTTTYAYNVPGKTSSLTDPLGRITLTTVDNLGRTIALKDPTNATTTTTYDADGRLTATTDPTGATTSFTFSSRSHLLTTKDPLNQITTYQHDPLGRRTATITPAPLSLRTEFTYDPAGNLLSTKRPDGKSITQTYDAMDRPITLTEPQSTQSNLLTQYTYHPTGTLHTLSDPRGKITTWLYDKLLRLTQKTYPNGNSHSYTYNAAGELLTHTTPNGHTATHTYSLKGQLLSQTWSTPAASATPTTTYTYFADGQPSTITHGPSTISYTYDLATQTTSESQALTGLPTLGYTATYDPAGRRKATTYSLNRTVDYSWTSRGQLASVSADGPPPLASYLYDPAGRLTSLSHENGTIETQTFDPNDRLLARSLTLATTTISTHAYTLDNLGRRSSEAFTGSPSSLVKNFTYDLASQVTSASYGGGLTDAFTYDPAANRTSNSRGGGLLPTIQVYTTNSANQYTAIARPTFNASPTDSPTYDANGNMLTTGNGITLTWDALNRLISVQNATIGNTLTNTFSYDALHRRITKQFTLSAAPIANRTTRYLYDGWNVAEEHNLLATPATIAGQFRVAYTWGADLSGKLQGAGGVGGLLMSERIPQNGGTASVFHHHYDGNGNTTTLTTPTGTLAATYRYDAFGNTISSTHPAPTSTQNTYRFSTKPLDSEIGTLPLYYYGYRYYNPLTARWPSRDPIEENGGVNLYAFVGNDGVNWVDVLGFDRTKWRGGNGRNFMDGPRNGNWGGKNWSGGRSPTDPPAPDKPPTDSGDECYMAHDKCYGACPECPEKAHKKCKETCDEQLKACLKKLPKDPKKWPHPPKLGTEGDSARFKSMAEIYF